MRGRLPEELPENGKRYDLTLVRAGLNRKKLQVGHFKIDNGPKKGLKLGIFLDSDVKFGLARAGDIPIQETNNGVLGPKHAGSLRISGVVTVTREAQKPSGRYVEVDEDYTDSNVFVTYGLEDIQEPNNSSELNSTGDRKSKFKRKPDKDDDVSGWGAPDAEDTDSEGASEDV